MKDKFPVARRGFSLLEQSGEHSRQSKRWLWVVEAKQQTTVDLMDDVCAETCQERLSGIRW